MKLSLNITMLSTIVLSILCVPFWMQAMENNGDKVINLYKEKKLTTRMINTVIRGVYNSVGAFSVRQPNDTVSGAIIAHENELIELIEQDISLILSRGALNNRDEVIENTFSMLAVMALHGNASNSAKIVCLFNQIRSILPPRLSVLINSYFFEVIKRYNEEWTEFYEKLKQFVIDEAKKQKKEAESDEVGDEDNEEISEADEIEALEDTKTKECWNRLRPVFRGWRERDIFSDVIEYGTMLFAGYSREDDLDIPAYDYIPATVLQLFMADNILALDTDLNIGHELANNHDQKNKNMKIKNLFALLVLAYHGLAAAQSEDNIRSLIQLLLTEENVDSALREEILKLLRLYNMPKELVELLESKGTKQPDNIVVEGSSGSISITAAGTVEKHDKLLKGIAGDPLGNPHKQPQIEPQRKSWAIKGGLIGAAVSILGGVYYKYFYNQSLEREK